MPSSPYSSPLSHWVPPSAASTSLATLSNRPFALGSPTQAPPAPPPRSPLNTPSRSPSLTLVACQRESSTTAHSYATRAIIRASKTRALRDNTQPSLPMASWKSPSGPNMTSAASYPNAQSSYPSTPTTPPLPASNTKPAFHFTSSLRPSLAPPGKIIQRSYSSLFSPRTTPSRRRCLVVPVGMVAR